MTLLKITHSGRFVMEQTFVEGKAWRDDRLVPQQHMTKNPMTGKTLDKYLKKNFHGMYGLWDEWDEIKKQTQEASNQRKNAVNTMNDEEVKLRKVINNISEFIAKGNVPLRRREMNKSNRKAIKEKNRLRDKDVKQKMRELEKDSRKKDRRDRNRINPLFKK